MLEAEWLSSGDFWRVLAAVAPAMSLRQSQLVACACLRFPPQWDEAEEGHVRLVEDHADSDRPEGAAGELYWQGRFGGALTRHIEAAVGVELRLEGDPNGRRMLRGLVE